MAAGRRSIGACIAAGGTLHLINQNRKRRQMEQERLMLARQTHRLLHHVYALAASELGHVPGPSSPGAGYEGPGEEGPTGPGADLM
jgi:hypothetical protein